MRITQKNILHQGKKCQKRYQYILNNEDVIRIRKYFEGKSFHLNEWKKNQSHCYIVTLCLEGWGRKEPAKEVTTQRPEIVKTQSALHTLQPLSPITWLLIPPFIIGRGASLVVVLFLLQNNWYKYLLQLGFSEWWWEWPQRQGWDHEYGRGPRKGADSPAEEMRQESESIHSIRGGIPGQGERFTSTGGPQEGAVEETVVLLGCETPEQWECVGAAEWAGEEATQADGVGWTTC